MFWIALAAQISAPEPRYMWLSNDDTPANLMGSRSAAVVLMQLTIAPDGRVHRCEIDNSSGDAQIDKYTCDLARRRALFRPAQSDVGTPVYGVYRVPVMWLKIPYGGAAERPKPWGNLTVRLSPAPKGVHLPATVRVAFAVDANGHISVCRDEPPSPGIAQNDPTLVPVACDQIRSKFAPAPARDDKGVAVPSVQNATVLISKN